MEEKKLYPFRLCSIRDEYSWGTEEFLLADLGYRDTLVREGWLAGNTMGELMETYLDRVVGDDVFDWYGRQFPFQVKMLKVGGKMPLRVNPPDDYARNCCDALGKEKFWFVVRAGKGSRLLLGFKRDTDAGTFCEACADGGAEAMLNTLEPRSGQYFHIPPGTPHCAWGDVDIIEISESSAMDYCLCGWGQPVSAEEFDTALDLAGALDFIDFTQFPGTFLKGRSSEEGKRSENDPEQVTRLLKLPQFSVSLLKLSDAMKISSVNFDSCIAYTCVNGAFELRVADSEDVSRRQNPTGSDLEMRENSVGERRRSSAAESAPVARVRAGETVLVPAECPDFFLLPAADCTVLLETLVEHRVQEDSYLEDADSVDK